MTKATMPKTRRLTKRTCAKYEDLYRTVKNERTNRKSKK